MEKNTNDVRGFDKNSTQWNLIGDMSQNRIILKCYQHYFNELLKARGYVFLRDIYEVFGFRVDRASVICGWVYDKDNSVEDNLIDFGVVEGEDYFDLDFNVYGVILERFF